MFGYMRTYLAYALLVVAMLVGETSSVARTFNHYFVGGLSYATPGGGVADALAAQPSLGLSLGYLYKAGQHVFVGIKGTWTRMTLGQVDTVDFTGFGVTHVGLYADMRYRPLKHGWSPYAEIEGGMGFAFADQVVANQPIRIDGLSEVKASVGTTVGVLIPLGEQVEADVSGRWFTTFLEDGFSMLGVQAGIAYALK